MIFAGPAVFLALLELGLSLCRVGYPTSFFIKSDQQGVLTTNIHFGWHYQQQTLTEPQPCLVPVEKPKDAIRIFVLGESAAMGMPDPSFGFARILEVMLRQYFPDHRLEVINAAMRGINAHVILPISKECAGLDPDLFILYMGNNELNGLYAPTTQLSFLGRHPALIPAFHRIKQTRTGQLLRRVLRANPEAAQKRRQVPTAEFFQSHRTALDDPQRQYVYRNFRDNLERICRHGWEAGADVIVSTVAVNLRDCPPLGSLHRRDLTDAQLQEWEGLYRKGIAFETAGDSFQAISCYEQAAALDDHYAELQFRLARCYLLAGRRDDAQRHFALARDWDALQFRADTRLNEIARQVAAELSGGGRRTEDGGQKTSGDIVKAEGLVGSVPVRASDATPHGVTTNVLAAATWSSSNHGASLRVAPTNSFVGVASGQADPSKAHGQTSLSVPPDTNGRAGTRDLRSRSAIGRVRLVAADQALAASDRCPDGVPGGEFFYEHVHLRFDGDYELARTILPVVVRSLEDRGVKSKAGAGQAPPLAQEGRAGTRDLPENHRQAALDDATRRNPQLESVQLPTREQCARALAFTAWDEVNTAAAMAQLTAQPPFTGQIDHAARQAAAEKAVAVVMDRVDEQFVNQAIQVYQEAIRARPDDWMLRYNLGAFLHQLERPREAAAHFDYVVRMFPHMAPFRVLLGYALGKAGMMDQAIEQFQQALKRDPRYREAREGLAWARAMKKKMGR